MTFDWERFWIALACFGAVIGLVAVVVALAAPRRGGSKGDLGE